MPRRTAAPVRLIAPDGAGTPTRRRAPAAAEAKMCVIVRPPLEGSDKRAIKSRVAKRASLTKMSKEVRSEEHTSELQSLMRISYAVFCLKKKNLITNTY